MKFDWSAFANDLRAYRERKGFGLRECSRAMPIGKSAWCRAENGKPVTVPIFVFLCEWMRKHPKTYAVSAPKPRPSPPRIETEDGK